MTPKCPKCNSEYVYPGDKDLWICPECAYEWSSKPPAESNAKEEPSPVIICDAFGNSLITGDSVTVIKELKIKGTSSTVKIGTKVKNIRLVDSSDGHNIMCKIDGLGSINLKSEFVKKV
jgi:protein PhnA